MEQVIARLSSTDEEDNSPADERDMLPCVCRRAQQRKPGRRKQKAQRRQRVHRYAAGENAGEILERKRPACERNDAHGDRQEAAPRDESIRPIRVHLAINWRFELGGSRDMDLRRMLPVMTGK